MSRNESHMSGSDTELPASDAPSWPTYFPYPTPYDEQVDGIKGFINATLNGRFAAMEGACGTGKTLISLVAGITLVRHPRTRYQTLFCTTGVKQQLDAFVDDMEAINANLPVGVEPVKGLQVVGKPDVCSWVDEGTLSSKGIYHTCNELRDPIWARIGREERRRAEDRDKRSALESAVEEKRVKKDSEWPPAVSGEDWTAPIRDEHDLRDSDDYCAFYAQHLLNEMNGKAPFTFKGMMNTRDVIHSASENGVCPHAALGSRLTDAEVVIANYNHVFDRRTRHFTEDLIGPNTLAVMDEAHTMEQKVRDMMEIRVGLSEFAATLNETSEILHTLQSTSPQIVGARNAFQNEMDRWGVSNEDLRSFRRLIARVCEWIAERTDGIRNSGDYQTPLRDPEKARRDAFGDWIESNDLAEMCLRGEYIGEAINRARNAAAQNVADYSRDKTHAPTVGQLLSAWVRRSTGDNYQSLVLERTNQQIETHDRVDISLRDHAWNGRQDPHLVLQNCIPRQIIADILGEFGGGLLMSATLEPLDIYETAVGLDRIGTQASTGAVSSPTPDTGEDDEGGEEGGEADTNTGAGADELTDSERMVYGMHFPPENRTSMAVDLTKFTYTNRNDPESDEGAATRREYARVMRDVVTGVDGNVLVAMPSYAEAEWAATALRGEWCQFDEFEADAMNDAVKKRIIVDESSSNEATQMLKQDFFEGPPKVLCTSLRGTLTEGVDFAGDRLKACVVCGVPIRSTSGKHATAIQNAYGRTFGGNGYESAFTIPAVRKARQAIGRVIRNDSDVGVRVLADARYTVSGKWGSVRELLPEYERDEFEVVTPGEVSRRIEESPLR